MARFPLLLSVAALTLATGAPAVAAGKDTSAASRPFIETSYLIAPNKVADFTLEGASYDDKEKYAGAGFRYALAGHQEIRFDVYVYPAGLLQPASAIDDGMKAFRHDLKLASEQGIYTQLSELHDAPFPLTTAEPDNSTTAHSNDAAVLKAITDAQRIDGHKLQMRMNLQPRDWPMYSSGYLFYKQLYYFKLRATAAQERITQETFDTLTDLAARTLIPALQVANVGGCAQATIVLNVDDAPEHAATELVRKSAQQQALNCHSDTQQTGVEALRATAAVVDITYSADEWKSR